MVSTTITFNKADVQAPVYVAGAFSEWSPVEMACEKLENGQNKFTHTVEVQPGKYQYKFRLGPGDWWALDESTPTEDDGSGNVNNVLTVEAEQTQESTPQQSEGDSESIGQAPIADTAAAADSATVYDTVAALEDELSVQPDVTTPDEHDVHKEASIPDVAPPPYSAPEHAMPLTTETHKPVPVTKVVDIERKSPEIGALPPPKKGGALAKKMLLVAAAVAIPVAFSLFLRR
ncbi:hypothetical protein PV08_05656 [Exophiala spinifera]|uniref:AMP-activated protein kinase glycogen-binding domain-containing protein n=1 Tax=Exophiala spinifera TaxID=91928 RepID=A0A0D2B9I7_9EURO|nr:uncharacterized protein PV08_05656 [Exophiala spinifera]KIW15608.1 hypothetical protein PV08_05656 [Exophiala spinifera]